MKLLRNLGCVVGLYLGLQATAQTAPPSAKKTAPAAGAGVCLLAEFRTLALTIHDPQLRMESAMDWLSRHARSCSSDQLKILNSYRASWMGTADHPSVQGLVDALIEGRSLADPQKLQELFTQGTTPPAPEIVGISAKPSPPQQPMPNYPGYAPGMQGYIQPQMSGYYGADPMSGPYNPMGGQYNPAMGGANQAIPPAPPPPPPPPARR